MRWFASSWSGVLAVALSAGTVFAQPGSSRYIPVASPSGPGAVGGPGCQALPQLPSGTGMGPQAGTGTGTQGGTGTGTQTGDGMGTGTQTGDGQGQGAGGGGPDFSGIGSGANGNYQGNLTASGTGLSASTTAATAAIGPGGSTVFTNVKASTSQSPLILPGLFTSMTAQPAVPSDRVFATYGYFSGFAVTNAGSISPGFNLHVFNIGAEKTFLDGRGSIYVQVPFLAATDNTTGQAIDGLGDISAGLKFALLRDCQTGSTFSAGMTVSAPTGRDTVVTTSQVVSVDGKPVTGPTTIIGNGGGTLPIPAPTTTTLNPTFLQPWVGGILVLNHLYIQEYLGVVIPTQDSISTFINNDVGIGYQICSNPGGLLSSVTPTFDAQLLLPINHQGSQAASPPQVIVPNGVDGGTTLPSTAPPTSFNSPYQVFLTGGVQLGLGDRALLSLGVVTPVVGPKAFSVGGVAGLNFFF